VLTTDQVERSLDAHYASSLSDHISSVFAMQPQVSDYRSEYPWLTGALGSETAKVVFVGENPSLTQIQSVSSPVNDTVQK